MTTKKTTRPLRPPRLYAPAFDFPPRPSIAADRERLAALLAKLGAGAFLEEHAMPEREKAPLLRVGCTRHPDAPIWPYLRSDAHSLALVCVTCKSVVVEVFNGTRLPMRQHQSVAGQQEDVRGDSYGREP